MTPNEQIKALAELDGWTFCPAIEGTRAHWLKHGEWTDDVPDYLTSYDAIIPLVQKYWDRCGYQVSLLNTPKQLAETVLRRTGKWND